MSPLLAANTCLLPSLKPGMADSKPAVCTFWLKDQYVYQLKNDLPVAFTAVLALTFFVLWISRKSCS